MNEDPNSGFVWRVSLGHVLTMLLVLFAAIGLACQTFSSYSALLDRISEKYESISERLAKVEAKVDILTSPQKR